MSHSESTPSPAVPLAPPGADTWRMAEHWPELVTALTDQSIESVNLLLRGLELLVHRGRITDDEYKVLAVPAERLKLCGVNAQQIVRFQGGRVRQSHEKIDLAYLIESVLQERRNELTLLGIAVRRKFRPVDVLIDPTLGFSLTTAMLEWSAPFGNRMELRLDVENDPARARLWLKTYTDHPPLQSAVFEDNIHWLLLCQIAATDGGIDIERQAKPDGVEFTARFRRTMAPSPAVAMPPATGTGDSVFHSINSAYVLICSAHPDTRLEALDIIRKLGVTVDGVASAAQALDAMHRREAHLLVLDRTHPPADMPQLQQALTSDHPLLPVIEIAETAEGSPHSERPVIARDSLHQTLGSTVMFTLSKVM